MSQASNTTNKRPYDRFIARQNESGYRTQIARRRGGYDFEPEPESESEPEWDEFGAMRVGGEDLYEEESLLAHGVPAIIEGECWNVEEENDDSDLDLHRSCSGVLSPRSKELTASGSSLFSHIALGGGRDGVVSITTDGMCSPSVLTKAILRMSLAMFGVAMTKPGLYKDEGDTVVRRRRHGDGKLLPHGRWAWVGLIGAWPIPCSSYSC